MDILNIEMLHFTIIKILVSTLIAILFLQSGFDKVLNYKGNLSYFQDYFKNSPLKSTVSLLLPTITILEVAAGLLSALGVFMILFTTNFQWGFWGLVLAAFDIICLFFGQRMAKDYAAAASIAGYFTLIILGLVVYCL
jgi:uncharacterized membrane protein YphA (DoxX/SURF4 family)